MYMTSSTAITSERGHKCGSCLLSAMASRTSPVQLLWEGHRIRKDVNLQEHKQKLIRFRQLKGKLKELNLFVFVK